MLQHYYFPVSRLIGNMEKIIYVRECYPESECQQQINFFQ